MSEPCALCGLDVGKQPFPLPTPQGELKFCCEGCRGIYEMLHDTAPAPGQNGEGGVASGNRH